MSREHHNRAWILPTQRNTSPFRFGTFATHVGERAGDRHKPNEADCVACEHWVHTGRRGRDPGCRYKLGLGVEGGFAMPSARFILNSSMRAQRARVRTQRDGARI